MSDGGKGSTARPFSVSYEKFASNWDKIFGRKLSEISSESSRGSIRINNEGKMEQFSEGYWTEIENRS